MYPTFSSRDHRPKTQVTNPFQRASSHRSHPALLKRMDITGARWGLDSAEAILTLRAVISNGDFEEYFALCGVPHRRHYAVSRITC